MNKNYFKARLLFFAGLLSVCWQGCSGGGGSSSSDGSSTASALVVSGQLSTASSSQKIGGKTDSDILPFAVNLSQYKVICATSSAPVKYGQGSVSSDGSFSVNIEGGMNQPMGCYLVDSAGTKVADFLISNSSKKDLNGNSEVSSTTSFKSNPSLGSINLDLNSGEVTVPSSQIAGAVNDSAPASGSVFDPTGAWTIGAVDFTLPAGVKSPCTGGGGGGGNGCQGPPEGQQIYFKLWKGVSTADSSNMYGLQLWQSESKYNVCGSKIGLTSTIKTQIGVDFSANGSADSAFTFPSTVTFVDQILSASSSPTISSGWKMSTATSQWDIMPNCGPRDVSLGGVTYSNAWVCGPDNSSHYQVSLGGGCVDASSNPVQLRDWSGITCGSTAIDSNGIRTQTCTGNASINSQTVAVTCSNKWAVTDSSYAAITSSSVNFNWTDLNASKISSGSLCSSISTATESSKIAQLQCYANYYHSSGIEDANACLPKVDMDWSATTAANFAVVDSIRPQGLVFFEQFKPFKDGDGGSMMTRQEHYEGVQLNGNSWVNCKVVETGGLTIKKVSDTKLLAMYQSSTITTSLTKPVCLAKFTGARETYLFYLSK